MELTPGIGTCFGFAIESALRFRYLRRGAGDPLRVEARDGLPRRKGELVLRWTPTADRPLDARLYAADGRYDLWIRDGGWYAIDPRNRTIAVPEQPDELRREERLWGIPLVLCFTHRGDHPLHAAAVEVDGDAILLAAPGTFGKTTLAAAFYARGHRLLAEDLSCLRASPDVSVIPGPAMLRMRRDVAERMSLPGATVIGESDARIHFALDAGERGDCEPLAVRAIVLLRHSEDGVRLERVDGVAALPDLWNLSFHVPTRDDRARSFAGVTHLVSALPVWNLFRPLHLDDLDATVAAIVSGV